ncbi:hypothetical protein MHL40_12550 [Pseudomonas luteola]|uniref:hypothetical protein n=1 Tax=Pseudomonas luteola TaxID=47886 RepID=UPI001EF52463|nr:hypothetical protein [Pseudomonas luteola]MCG7373496.1 hypothetical protein [Pseudomonas luteola]
MRYQKQAVALVVAWFMVGGFAHLFMAGFFVKLVPIDVPYRFAIVCFGGILEMMVAVAVLFKELRRYAGSVLFVCTLLMLPVHFYTWQHAGLFPALPEWALAVRLVLHALFPIVIWYGCIHYTPPAELVDSEKGADKGVHGLLQTGVGQPVMRTVGVTPASNATQWSEKKRSPTP